MKKLIGIILSFTLLVTACASPKNNSDPIETPNGSASAESSGDRMTCAQGTDSRIIEIKKTKSDGCELFYTKFGNEKSVATSVGKKYCSEMREKIKSNLAQAGFKCE